MRHVFTQRNLAIELFCLIDEVINWWMDHLINLETFFAVYQWFWNGYLHIYMTSLLYFWPSLFWRWSPYIQQTTLWAKAQRRPAFKCQIQLTEAWIFNHCWEREREGGKGLQKVFSFWAQILKLCLLASSPSPPYILVRLDTWPTMRRNIRIPFWPQKPLPRAPRWASVWKANIHMKALIRLGICSRYPVNHHWEREGGKASRRYSHSEPKY